jgi:hypothetical protein
MLAAFGVQFVLRFARRRISVGSWVTSAVLRGAILLEYIAIPIPPSFIQMCHPSMTSSLRIGATSPCSVSVWTIRSPSPSGDAVVTLNLLVQEDQLVLDDSFEVGTVWLQAVEPILEVRTPASSELCCSGCGRRRVLIDSVLP